MSYAEGWRDAIHQRTPQAMVREFHEAFGLAVDAEDTAALRIFRYDLLEEEFREAGEALGSMVDQAGNLDEVAKELADLVYVAFGAAVSLGIDLEEAFQRVHASNMSKLGDDGKPLRREDGKILKGPNYRPPSMDGVVRRVG